MMHIKKNMANTINLAVHKKKLSDNLGESFKGYLSFMKLWFRQKLTKDEFDFEARKLLDTDGIRYHNEFLIALLNKCSRQSSSSHLNKDSPVHSQTPYIKERLKKSCMKQKSKPMRGSVEHRLKPEYPLSHAPQLVSRDPAVDTKVSFCSRDMTLPDVSMVHGRMFVTAWDCGLDSVDEDAVKLLMIAIERHLKTILMEIFCQRKSYKLRDGSFRYALGSAPPNPYLNNTARFKESVGSSEPTSILNNSDHVPRFPYPSDMTEGLAAHEVSCCIENRKLYSPVSLFELFHTLQVKKNLIPSHSVYAINMERIAAKLTHPSHEELEQENIHQQEKHLREQLKTQHLLTTWNV